MPCYDPRPSGPMQHLELFHLSSLTCAARGASELGVRAVGGEDLWL